MGGSEERREEGGRIDPRLLKSCSGFSWSEVCACRRASPVQPPQEELFMERKPGSFKREKDLHNTSEVDKNAPLGYFCALSCVFSSGV